MLLEECISCFLQDPQIEKTRGFFRSLPLISVNLNSVYTYHAKRWYYTYMHQKGTFDNFFDHKWVYIDDINDPKLLEEYDSFTAIIVRSAIESPELKDTQVLDRIIKSAHKTGFNQIVLSTNDAKGLRINEKRIRPIEGIVPITPYDDLYNNWTINIDNFRPTISCMSKNIILKAYGIYELARSSLNSSSRKVKFCENFNDMMELDFPLIIMDILHKIISHIKEPDPSTHIKVSDIIRYLTPWFENRKELIRLRNICYEKIKDISNIDNDYRIGLGEKIEHKLYSWCEKDEDFIAYNKVKKVIDHCVV